MHMINNNIIFKKSVHVYLVKAHFSVVDWLTHDAHHLLLVHDYLGSDPATEIHLQSPLHPYLPVQPWIRLSYHQRSISMARCHHNRSQWLILPLYDDHLIHWTLTHCKSFLYFTCSYIHQQYFPISISHNDKTRLEANFPQGTHNTAILNSSIQLNGFYLPTPLHDVPNRKIVIQTTRNQLLACGIDR